ncbi:hypothetical protein [Cupriavidus taiwanensis]|uniref:Uncharacterized protein n=1 Tax=Cupriavidus taiwanensis TaxID=164546 RepID=A0A7Z7NPW8_9BURK|nr:hypothetical protein [Cupriavidus taiwanensis]SOZ17004.1 hypothetical protein CBM2597_P340023 [Cupriavidus taiwanensis]SOZ95932.1 hypothetical protein CBM2598_P310027 [Cupriavidus taiwanensis]SPC25409.1 hypothetical protein CBM2594_P310028 [Cupriavidus taiwanensis]SPD37654.1 protein of unknown function [Cupriavidus taiwanensis]
MQTAPALHGGLAALLTQCVATLEAENRNFRERAAAADAAARGSQVDVRTAQTVLAAERTGLAEKEAGLVAPASGRNGGTYAHGRAPGHGLAPSLAGDRQCPGPTGRSADALRGPRRRSGAGRGPRPVEAAEQAQGRHALELERVNAELASAQRRAERAEAEAALARQLLAELRGALHERVNEAPPLQQPELGAPAASSDPNDSHDGRNSSDRSSDDQEH